MSSPFAHEKLYNIEGRIALVTGGGTGIGYMIAQGLAANGATVYISGRRKEVLDNSADTWNKGNQGHGSIVPLASTGRGRDGPREHIAGERRNRIQARQTPHPREQGRSRSGHSSPVQYISFVRNCAGQTGPVSRFFNDLSAPEHKDPETLGRALFENESFEEWSDMYQINTFSVFFVTTAFLGLLAKGSADVPGYTSSVINITSISGIIKLAQNHFGYNSAKAAVSHLTKMFATEFVLKNVPVRVCAIAPGVYESEMTHAEITTDLVDKVGLGIQPVPARRPGTAQEVAGTVVYLASPAGCYTNGQEIIIDGGYTSVNPATA